MLKVFLVTLSLIFTGAVVAEEDVDQRLNQIIAMSDMMVCDPVTCTMTSTGDSIINSGNPIGMYLVFDLDYVKQDEIIKYRDEIMGYWVGVVNGDMQ